MVASCSSHCEAAVSADGDMFVVVLCLKYRDTPVGKGK
jgi:hypothetical protein